MAFLMDSIVPAWIGYRKGTERECSKKRKLKMHDANTRAFSESSRNGRVGGDTSCYIDFCQSSF